MTKRLRTSVRVCGWQKRGRDMERNNPMKWLEGHTYGDHTFVHYVNEDYTSFASICTHTREPTRVRVYRYGHTDPNVAIEDLYVEDLGFARDDIDGIKRYVEAYVRLEKA